MGIYKNMPIFFSWLQKNGWYIIAAIGIMILIFLGNQDNRLIQSILKKSERANARHDKLTKEIAQAKEAERLAKQKSEEQHRKELEQIEKNKNQNLSDLDEKTKKEVQDKLKDGPLSDEELEKLANKFRDRHGFR